MSPKERPRWQPNVPRYLFCQWRVKNSRDIIAKIWGQSIEGSCKNNVMLVVGMLCNEDSETKVNKSELCGFLWKNEGSCRKERLSQCLAAQCSAHPRHCLALVIPLDKDDHNDNTACYKAALSWWCISTTTRCRMGMTKFKIKLASSLDASSLLPLSGSPFMQKLSQMITQRRWH